MSQRGTLHTPPIHDDGTPGSYFCPCAECVAWVAWIDAVAESRKEDRES